MTSQVEEEGGGPGGTPLNISFSGCGFLGIYHVGVIQCLRENAPSLIPRFQVVAGASAGAIASLVLLSNCPAERVCKGFIDTSESLRSHWIGALSMSCDVMAVLNALFDDLIPPQTHRLCQGRLRISLTSVSDLKNHMASNFNTRLELIKALKATCYIPVWAGLRKHCYRGKAYMDGGISNNLPTDFPGETITVSPFSGEADICPRDQLEGWDMTVSISGTSVRMTLANAIRMKSALFPPHPSVLERMYRGGYQDCLRFLERRGWMENMTANIPESVPCSSLYASDGVASHPDATSSAERASFPLFTLPRQYLNGAHNLLAGMYSILHKRASSSYSSVVSPSLVFLLAALDSLMKQMSVGCLRGFLKESSAKQQQQQHISKRNCHPFIHTSETLCPLDVVKFDECNIRGLYSQYSTDSGISESELTSRSCSPFGPYSLDEESGLLDAFVRS